MTAQTHPRHQVSRAVTQIHALLDQVADSSLWSMDTVETGHTLTELTRASARLAELEARLQAGDLMGLAERFAGGRISARDLTAILGAGLRGAGNALTDDDLARMSIEGGLKGAAEIAARLLRATFGESA